jgi:hypothetical protein
VADWDDGSGNSVQNWTHGLWKLREERHTAPHLHVTLKKKCNKITTRVAVNTILGKGDKSFLAY